MPDLSTQATHDFWKNFHDPSIYRIICHLESVENWALDGHKQLEESIEKLGTALDDTGNIDVQNTEEDFIKLVSHLTTGRGLMILMNLDMASPGSASKVLVHSEKNASSQPNTCGFFVKRNVVFERMRMLSRIFSEERILLITKALEEGGL